MRLTNASLVPSGAPINIKALIFGRIIDQYALNPDNKPDAVLVRGALWWLLVAATVALAAPLYL